MKSFVIFIIGAVVGGAAALLFLPGALVGMGAGVGIASGVKTGTCLTVEAAKEKGFITAEQVGELIAAAGQQLSAANVTSDKDAMASGDADCTAFIEELKAAKK